MSQHADLYGLGPADHEGSTKASEKTEGWPRRVPNIYLLLYTSTATAVVSTAVTKCPECGLWCSGHLQHTRIRQSCTPSWWGFELWNTGRVQKHKRSTGQQSSFSSILLQEPRHICRADLPLYCILTMASSEDKAIGVYMYSRPWSRRLPCRRLAHAPEVLPALAQALPIKLSELVQQRRVSFARTCFSPAVSTTGPPTPPPTAPPRPASSPPPGHDDEDSSLL